MQSSTRLPSVSRSGSFDVTSSAEEEEKYCATGPAPIIDLKEMHAALAVAEELHFTRAAERLNITQSALSRQIQQLESALGVELFKRGTRRVELTEAGDVFVRHARKTLEQARAAILRTQAISKGEASEFLVTHSPLIDVHLVTSMQSLVESSRPRIPVRYRSIQPGQQTQMLLSGVSQLGIVILPLEADDLETTCLIRERLMVALPSGHALARKRQIQARDLTDEPVIWLAHDLYPGFIDHTINLFQRAGYAPNMTGEVQSLSEALGFVREKRAISFVKRSEERMQVAEVAVRPFAEPFLMVETGLAYPRRSRSDFLQELVQLLTSHFRCPEP